MHGLVFDLSLPFRQVQPGSPCLAGPSTQVLASRLSCFVRGQFSLKQSHGYQAMEPAVRLQAVPQFGLPVGVLGCGCHL